MGDIKVARLLQEIESIKGVLTDAQNLLSGLVPNTVVHVSPIEPCAPIIIKPPRLARGCMRPIETEERDVTVQDFIDTISKIETLIGDIGNVVRGLDQTLNLPGKPDDITS
jgi:hypothetical protein